MSEIVSKRKFDNEEHEAYLREHNDISRDKDYEMNLKDSDRKILWALSKNKCALCKNKLVRKKDFNTNVGEECHISSEKPNWPSKEFSRYEPSLDDDKRNKSIENAILLCAICHKIIDNPKSIKYTIEELHQIKERHEEHEEEIKLRVGRNGEILLNPEIIKERIEKRKQLKEWIQEHNQELIFSIQKWDCFSKNYSLAEKHAIEHLRTGYLNIWNIWFEDYKALIKQILEEEYIIKEYIKSNLYLELEDIILSDYYFLEQDMVTLNSKINGFDMILDLLFVLSDSNNERYKNVIKTIKKDKSLYEMFQKLNETNKYKNEIIIKFKNCLDKIVHDFMKGHIELKGNCRLCKNWHDELKIIEANGR